ncbi:MAG: hypothetical protein KDK89_09240 [Alphaproteobacteria bacterium]|nr:hypothetical protein [Alphaproteobacteria bacterium]
MSKLMWIAGILLMAVGIALGLMIFFSPASIVAWGIVPDTAALLIVGGVLSLGIGGVVNAIENLNLRAPAVSGYGQTAPPPDAPPPDSAFGQRSMEGAVTAAATAAVAVETVSPEVKQTIEAIEDAKQSLNQAFAEPPVQEDVATATESAAEAPAAEQPAEPEADVVQEEEPVEAMEAEEAIDDGQLYVVEERTIRNRPARILSDGTVEAETDEGWMRFENLEHLDEYLEAMASASRG